MAGRFPNLPAIQFCYCEFADGIEQFAIGTVPGAVATGYHRMVFKANTRSLPLPAPHCLPALTKIEIRHKMGHLAIRNPQSAIRNPQSSPLLLYFDPIIAEQTG